MLRAAALIAGILSLSVPAAAQDAADWIRSTLSQAVERTNTCGRHQAAIFGTLDRLRNVSLPAQGKVLVVNIPAGVVTAYDDGVPVIESRAVVGRETTQTPLMDTHVTYIRPNPTWTVPESILARKKWREKLAYDPAYFERGGFDVIVGGQAVSPYDAAHDPSIVSAFVQRPGKENALGRVKIGISNSQAIYLHDTNEPAGFEDEVRLASAGCVRIESINEIAAWALGTDTESFLSMIEGGDVTNYHPAEHVRVILGYWTAWPDGEGDIRFYPDVYGFDEEGDTCEAGMSDAPTSPGATEFWTEYRTR